MSQAKVDKRKYEKVHRKEIEKKRKIKTTVKCITAALIIGAIIGVPTAYNIYKSIPKFVGDSTLEAFVSDYIDTNHASDIAVLKEDDTTEATTESTEIEDVIQDAVEEATGKETEKVDAENVDEVLESEE